MDQKHREYCIKLGNPYMKQDKFSKVNLEQVNEPWIPVENNTEEDWNKINKKFN